ncbi:nitrogen regulation protein NR(II) [Psychromonas aquatilis]|uniref:histidine kinase n=1 Tax=Psychromonas aquatilis TaxID=2005072 RepID=A0ABU9GML8_9GAMM
MLKEPCKELAFTFLEEAQTAFLVLDTSLKVIYTNPASEHLLSQSKQRLYGNYLKTLAKQYHFSSKIIEELLVDQSSFTANELSLLIDGQPILIDLSANYIIINSISYVLIEMRCIEHQKRISQVHYQEHQQKAAQELVRGLAHEIKNPLGGLRGAAQLLEAELPSADLKEFTQIIIEQADRLSALVNRLLGPQKVGTKSIHNIHSVLESVRKLVNLNLPQHIKIKMDYDPSIPDFEMQPDQLQQALLNIVQNAVQALQNEPGEHTITLRTRAATQVVINGLSQRLSTEIKVIDTGPGIPEHLQSTLFYPMVTGRKDGTGLGLSIAQELIKQHFGRIEVASQKGKTEFSIYLPI